MQEFDEIIRLATKEQRQTLAELTGSKFGDAPETLCHHIRYLKSGSLGQLFWNDSWKQVVTDVADQVGIDWQEAFGDRQWCDLKTQEIETAVVIKLFQKMLKQLSPEQQQKLVREMQKDRDDPHVEPLLVTGGVMTLAQMSGFGVYLMASTVLGGLSHALGITLPFAIYLGMSQTIAFILGPIGWAALSVGILFTINQPNWNRLILAVVYISLLRYSGLENRTPPERLHSVNCHNY